MMRGSRRFMWFGVVGILCGVSMFVCGHAWSDYLQPLYTVETQGYVTYGTDADSGLDLYLFANVPTDNSATNKPAVMFLHGYGENVGASNARAVEFSELGYVTFNVGWTPLGVLLPADPFANVKAAVRWVKIHATEYGVDPDKIAVYGYSYGGYLATKLAVTDDTDGGVSSRVAVVAEMSGLVGDAYPANFDQSDSPLIIFHGEADETVNFNNALTIRSACQDADLPYAFFSYPGVGHARTTMFTSEIYGKTGFRWMAEFFAYHLYGEQPEAEAAFLYAPRTGSGSVDRSPVPSLYAKGTTVTLTAVPETGYTFAGWSDGISSSANPLTVDMQHPLVARAVFEPIAAAQYSVDVAADGYGGSVSRTPDKETYGSGDTVQIVGQPIFGYVLDYWTGDASGAANPLVLTVNGNKVIRAVFVKAPDADQDGLPDALEPSGDADGDGLANYLDSDADADGVPDGTEWLLMADPFDFQNPTRVPLSGGVFCSVALVLAGSVRLYREKR